jgi:hypothetical protein
MHMTVFMISLVVWLVGVATASTLGGLIHVLLLVAVVTAAIRFTQRRRRLAVASQAR